jgi:WD40 repeat protein
MHTSPVLDIAWNYDETFFASADSSGMVIVWNRDDKDTFDID